jgi:dethiobiotin synthetase
MTRALFVTGTDTGVGKTLVARAVCAAAHAAGLRVAPFKPFESGCTREATGVLRPADALALRAACSLDESDVSLTNCNIYSFEGNVAPSIAAEVAGVSVDEARVARACATLRERFDLVVIEGAGGLLVPLGAGLLVADLAAHLGAPLLVVARDALGTINHTLLTISEARRRGLPVTGVVLSRASPSPTPDREHNAAAIAQLGRVRVFGTLPFLPDADSLAPARLARLAASSLDLPTILAAAA